MSGGTGGSSRAGWLQTNFEDVKLGKLGIIHTLGALGFHNCEFLGFLVFSISNCKKPPRRKNISSMQKALVRKWIV
jgi:hypothetical protein